MMNPTSHRRAPYLIVAAAVALSMSACASTTTADKAKTSSSASAAKTVPSAKVLYEMMRKNAAAAKSFRIKGEITTGGRKLTIDVAGDRDGKNTRALIKDGTLEAELLTVAGGVYVKANAAYWTKNANAATAKVVSGKYVKVPAGAGVMDDLKVGSFLDGVFAKDLPQAGAQQKVEATNLGGVPAYVLTDKVAGDNSKLYVSADGQARLMRLVSAKVNIGTLDFTEWDAVAPMNAPSADQLVKIPGLG